MGDKTITITKKDFADAVAKAQEKWTSIGNEAKSELGVKDGGLPDLVMMVQNTLFSSLIADVLFDKEDQEN